MQSSSLPFFSKNDHIIIEKPWLPLSFLPFLAYLLSENFYNQNKNNVSVIAESADYLKKKHSKFLKFLIWNFSFSLVDLLIFKDSNLKCWQSFFEILRRESRITQQNRKNMQDGKDTRNQWVLVEDLEVFCCMTMLLGILRRLVS